MLSELRFPIEKLIRQFEILNLESKISCRGRLAPSPTVYLHVGHAVTFWCAQERCPYRGTRQRESTNATEAHESAVAQAC